MSDDRVYSKDIDLAAVMIDGVGALFLLPPMATFTVSSVRSITQLNEDEFLEKLQLFLKEVDTSREIKDKFLKSLNKDADKFFKRLFKVLDRIEDKEKAVMIGRLFKAVVEEKVSVDNFRAICTAIDNTYFGTLEYLYHFEKKASERVPKYTTPFQDRGGIENQQLVASGLVYENLKITTDNAYDENRINQSANYELTELGELLYIFGLDPQHK